MNGVVVPPGWHGKLPSLGDFASRRLAPAFVEAWDGWLAAGLLALRDAQPERWLEAYLASPSWRFLLMPGVLPGTAGRDAWAGVLMPSVDRVGRYFPLTLVQPLATGPDSTQQMAALWQWLARLDDLARDALYEDWTCEQLEEQLARMAPPDATPLPLPVGQTPAAAGMVFEMSGSRPQADDYVDRPPRGNEQSGRATFAHELPLDPAWQIGAEAQRAWAAGADGRAWWYARPDDAAPRLLLSRGLPAAAQMARLFGPAGSI